MDQIAAARVDLRMSADEFLSLTVREAASLWARWREAEDRWTHRFQDAFCWYLTANRDPEKRKTPYTRDEVFREPEPETPELPAEEQRRIIEEWERSVREMRARKVTSNGR